MKKILAIIPARGGSKGLPGKNIIDLGGKPLINWTIDEAKKSKYINEIFVSTDDLAIKEVAEKNGIVINRLRPKELSQDDTLSIDVILDVLSQPEFAKYEIVCMLQPTSPLRKVQHIDEAFEQFFELDASCCVSVCENEYSPYWSFEIQEGKLKSLFSEDSIPLRRQDLPQTYSLNGAIYIAKVDWLKETKSFLTKQTIAYVMGAKDSIDIDDQEDLDVAKSILKNTQ
ncbi:acylneuraminate cytidylyltransferase family protein [Aquirufa sp. Wall-65K1]